MSSSLERLVARVEQAAELGFLTDEWRQLARAAAAEVASEWLTERAFRMRTGASDKWVRTHFTEYETEGLARRDSRGHREWHVHARLPRARGRDAGAIKRQIVESFDRRTGT